jgi:hypothetical protein
METTTRKKSRTITLRVSFPQNLALAIKMAISTTAVELTVMQATCKSL